jgi:hypothetical protein
MFAVARQKWRESMGGRASGAIPSVFVIGIAWRYAPLVGLDWEGL